MNALQDAIRKLHGCESEHVENVPITETFEGETVWEGVVSVFSLIGHPTASRCYVWAHEADSGKTRCVAVLHVPPVDSPAAAVRAAIVKDAKNREN